jgi:hypothetical protein
MSLCSWLRSLIGKLFHVSCVLNTTSCTSEDEFKWSFTTIWFNLLKQNQIRHRSWLQLTSLQWINIYVQRYILCAYWGLDVAPIQSSWSSGISMHILPLPLLRADCLSHSSPGGPGPPSAPSFMVTPFPSGSTHTLVPLSVTSCLL